MLKETYSRIYHNRISTYNLLSEATRKVLKDKKCPEDIMVIFDGIIWAYLNDVVLTSALTVDETKVLLAWLNKADSLQLLPFIAEKLQSELGVELIPCTDEDYLKVIFSKISNEWDTQFWKSLFRK